MAARTCRLILAIFCSCAAFAAAAHQAAPESGSRISAQPVGEPSVSVENWGTLGEMVEPVWLTQGLPIQRTTALSWLVPGKILVIRHGNTERMKLGIKFADTVQRVEINSATRTFAITYIYENGRTLNTTGRIDDDGIFAELLTAADGTPQRNLYMLDTPRKMRLVRQKRAGAGWMIASTVIKVGETPAEKVAREQAEQRQRDAEAAAQRAREAAERAEREAEEEARYAEEEAEREADAAESQAQQQRNWQRFQNDMSDIVQKQRDDIADSRRFQERIRITVENAEAERRRRQQEAERAAAEAQRLRQQQVDASLRGQQQQQQLQQQRTAQLERERQDVDRKRLAEQQRLTQQQQQSSQQQAQEDARAKQERAKREAEARAKADNPMMLWKEGVVLCEPPKSGGGEWACHGPLQTTYGHPDKPSGAIAVRQACGNGTGDRTRELGQSGGFRTYGCGWGQNPAGAASRDPSVRFGVFVPGRTTFSCPKKQSGVCRNAN